LGYPALLRFTRPHAHLPTCLPACLPAFLPSCLPCLPVGPTAHTFINKKGLVVQILTKITANVSNHYWTFTFI
jgi:hypothetical protein